MSKLSGLTGWKKVAAIVGTAGVVSGSLGASAIAIVTQIFPTPIRSAEAKGIEKSMGNAQLKKALTTLINDRMTEVNDNVSSLRKLLVDELRTLKTRVDKIDIGTRKNKARRDD